MKLYKGRENLKEFKPHIKVMEDEQERDNKEEKVSKEKFDENIIVVIQQRRSKNKIRFFSP